MRFVLKRLRLAAWKVALAVIVFMGLGVAARLYLPTNYQATTQVLFDPRGFRLFANELSPGVHDANAAIAIVESQMSVLQSERVFVRVIDVECAVERARDAGSVDPASPPLAFAPFCPETEANAGDINRALQSMRRSVTIKRNDRSFVVDVTATGASPLAASRLANEIVKAYREEDADNRLRASQRLNSELEGRLEPLRAALRASEARADVYRRDRNLVRVGDRLLVDQRLAAATVALNEAQGRLDKALARVRQLEASPPRSISAVATLGLDIETRTLLALLERRSAVAVEIAPLEARAGARHPALVEARSRIFEIDRAIDAEIASIRAATSADLARVRTEHNALSDTVNDLTGKVVQARQAEIDLRALEQDVEANRKLVESFELRAREAAEFGKIDSGNFRVVSLARAPDPHKMAPRLILWGLLGMVVGLMISLGLVLFFALLALEQVQRRPAAPAPFVAGFEQGPLYQMRLRAEAFAHYRYR